MSSHKTLLASFGRFYVPGLSILHACSEISYERVCDAHDRVASRSSFRYVDPCGFHIKVGFHRKTDPGHRTAANESPCDGSTVALVWKGSDDQVDAGERWMAASLRGSGQLKRIARKAGSCAHMDGFVRSKWMMRLCAFSRKRCEYKFALIPEAGDESLGSCCSKGLRLPCGRASRTTVCTVFLDSFRWSGEIDCSNCLCSSGPLRRFNVGDEVIATNAYRAQCGRKSKPLPSAESRSSIASVTKIGTRACAQSWPLIATRDR
jgi:hypothetical protein